MCLANLAIHVPHMPARLLVGAREQLGASAARFEAALKELQRRFQPDGEAEDASSAAAKLVGTWSKDTLDKALGVEPTTSASAADGPAKGPAELPTGLMICCFRSFRYFDD